MASIAELITTEYGIYLKGVWDASSATVEVADDYYLPLQEVNCTSIVFSEEPPDPSWNVVMHRHPSSCTSFSQTDDKVLNKEFLASILFIAPWSFPQCIVNVPLCTGSKMQIQSTVLIGGPIMDADEALYSLVRNCITSKTPTPKEPRALSSLDAFCYQQGDDLDY